MRTVTSNLHLIKPEDGDGQNWTDAMNGNLDTLDACGAIWNGAVVPVDIDMTTGKSTSLFVKVNKCFYKNFDGIQVSAPESAPIALPPNSRTYVYIRDDGTPAIGTAWGWGSVRLAIVTTDATAVQLPIEDYRYNLTTTPEMYVSGQDEFYLPYGSANASGTPRLGAPVTSVDGYPVMPTPDSPDAPTMRRIIYYYENTDIYVSLPPALNNVNKIILVGVSAVSGNNTGTIHLKEMPGSDFSYLPTIGTKGMRLVPGETWWFTGTSEDGYDTIGHCPVPPIDPA